MTTLTVHTQRRVRIISAIAAKDVAEAIRNKTVLSVLLGVAVLLLSAQAFPLLTSRLETQRLVVYTADWDLLRTLRRRDDLAVAPAGAAEAVPQLISETSGADLGVNLDEPQPAGDGPLAFTAYQVHWLREDKAAAAQATVESALGEVLGRPVALEREPVFPTANAGGFPGIAAMTFMNIVFAVGAILVPYLFMEEREGKTLDMLLVSPASVSEVVAGKAVAGMVYALAAAVVILVLYNYLIVLWPLAILVTLLAGLLAVMVGLCFGAFLENQGVLGLVAGAVLALMLIPPFLEQLALENVPPFVATLIHWLPSTALARLFRLSMTSSFSLEAALPDLVLIVGFILALFLLVVWRVRRIGR